MPERRRPRSARSSSVIDIGIVDFLCGELGVFVPEALVVIDWADRRVRLGIGSRRRRGVVLLALEYLFDGLVRDEPGLQHARAGGLDLQARVVTDQIGQSVKGLLAGTAKACEHLLGDLAAVRADLLGLGQQLRGLTRWIVDTVRLGDFVMPLAQ